MLSLTPTPNADAVVIKFLKNLSVINVDDEAVSAELEKHPDYPSLLAVSDVLTSLHVDNSAYKVEHNEVLNDWYNQKQKSYEAWAKIYPVALDDKKNKKHGVNWPK
jgi:hypothetical protein